MKSPTNKSKKSKPKNALSTGTGKGHTETIYYEHAPEFHESAHASNRELDLIKMGTAIQTFEHI